VTGIRAESHPQAEFPCALRDRAGHDGVEAHAGEQQRQAAKDRDQSDGDQLRGGGAIHLFLQGDHLVESEIWIHCMHGTEERGQHGIARLGGAQIENRLAHEVLAERYVEEGKRRFAQAVIAGVGGDSHDTRPASVHLEALPDRIAAAPVPHHRRTIHDGHQRCGFVVSARKIPARQQRNAESRKVAGADLVVLDLRLFIGWRLIAIHGNARGRESFGAERRDARPGGLFHARKSAHALHQIVLKGPRACRIVARGDQRDAGGEDATG
jgi:hypothetical protein